MLDGLPPRERDVAMVFQHGALYPHLSVYGNMAFSLTLRRTAKAEIGRRVRDAAATLGIEDLLDRRPGQLSGGQRQRVALGRALVRQPKLFLFDEPLSNLEAGLRSQLQDEIRRLHARLGATAVYVTHDQTEAMTAGPAGRGAPPGPLAASGRSLDPLPPAGESLRGRADRHAADEFSRRPHRAIRGRLAVPGRGNPGRRRPLALPIPAARTAALAAYVGRAILLGVRPEHLSVAGSDVSAGAARLPAIVEAVERPGPVSHVSVRAGSHALVARMEAACALAEGQPVLLAVAMDEAQWFDAETEQAVGGYSDG